VSSPGQRAAGRAYADRVQQVIAARFRERLTLADFARAAGCSVFHLSRTVRAHAGSPIHRLLMRARLREALELILDRPGDLTRLALSLGFASHSHLSDAFKREYGVAPGQLKRISRTMLAAARRRAESP
jgi:AraC-like DNA-binding protein